MTKIDNEFFKSLVFFVKHRFLCGHRIMVITQAFQACDTGSIPAARSRRADMAQLVERTLGKGEVPSSILGISTIS